MNNIYQIEGESDKVSQKRTRRQMLATGFASPADNFIEDRLNINDLLIKNDTSTYFFRLHSFCSDSPFFHQGDIVVVDRSLPVANNSYALAVYEESFTIVSIESPHDAVKNLLTGNLISDEVEIWGIIVYTIHSFGR